jgi:hypothetical protein
MPSSASPSPVIRVGPSWGRRKWRALTAWLGDHPWLAALAGLLLTGMVLFYGIRLNGFAHLSDALGRWRMEVFGGTFRVERSIEVPDVFLSLRSEEFDRVDAMSSSAAFLGGTAFRRELAVIVQRKGARIRVVALDPRMGTPGHPRHAEFAAEAAAFGLKPWEYAARCRHSAAVLLHLLEDFAPGLEVRFLDVPMTSGKRPFFLAGRSVQLYRADDPASRLDVVVPRPAEPDGVDSFAHPGLIIRHRIDDPEVKRFRAAFDEAWAAARPADRNLQDQTINALTVPP